MKFWGVRLVSIVLAIGGAALLPELALGMDGGRPGFLLRMVALAGLYVTLAVSLNLINGITGQFSIGHAGFYMVGAYAGGFLTRQLYQTSGVPELPWLVMMVPVGMLAAAIVGLMVGLPSLRLRGDYLAIVTLGFGEIIRIVVQSRDELGGSYGMQIVPLSREIWSLDPTMLPTLIWILAFLTIALCRNLLKTAHGLQFLAVREDEMAASAMGVNATAVKVTAFVVGSALAGAAGVLFGHMERFVTPDQFKMDLSFIILTMVVLGGTGSITGSTLAAVALFGLPEFMRTLEDAQGRPLALSGAVLAAGVVATILTVAAIKRIELRWNKTARVRALAMVGAVLAGLVVWAALSPLFATIPAMAAKSYQLGQLRMVLFAAALVIVMLLRPQGIFAHHEFSWARFQRKRSAEVAA